jgi:hypothetical protein
VAEYLPLGKFTEEGIRLLGKVKRRINGRMTRRIKQSNRDKCIGDANKGIG